MNAVNPGLIDTQIARDVVAGNEEAYDEMAKNVPIGRAGRPEEIASAVLWLCSPGASYVVGHALTVDGGRHGALIPALTGEGQSDPTRRVTMARPDHLTGKVAVVTCRQRRRPRTAVAPAASGSCP